MRQALGHVGTRPHGASELCIISLSFSLTISLSIIGDELREFKVEDV